MLQLKINGNTQFDADQSKEGLMLNGSLFECDLIQIEKNKYHALVNNQSFVMEVVKVDRAAKQVQVKINGKIIDVQAKDRFDLLLEKMGMSNATVVKANDLKAPMPGLILDIPVQIGDAVKKGEKVMVLEAMKMENVLKAPADVVIKDIKVVKGQSVDKNHILVVFA